MMVDSLLGNVNDKDSSTTQSAVSQNINLDVRNGEIPTALSRNTESANQKVKQFDKTEYEERAEMAQVIGQISNNSIVLSLKPKLDDAAQQKAEAEVVLASDSTAEQKAAAQIQLATADNTIEKYGKGGAIQMAVRAVTGVLQGIATGSAEIGKRAVENNWVIPTSPYQLDQISALAIIEQAMFSYEEAKKQSTEEVKTLAQDVSLTLAEAGLDFVPILGDAKGFYDAEDGIDYILATLGVIPAADFITKPLKEAKERDLGRKLSLSEMKELRDNSTAISLPKEIHQAGRTYGCKNIAAVIAKDAQDLCQAQICDLSKMKDNLIKAGYSEIEVNDAIQKIIERNKTLGVE